MARRALPMMALILVVTGLACSRPELAGAAKRIQVVDAPLTEGCTPLGPVRGESGGAGGIYIADDELLEYATNDMLNRAAEMGATHVHLTARELGELDGVTNRGTVQGVAYRCGPRVTTATQATEERIRALLDARAPDILACTGTRRLGVRVDYAPGEPLAIGLPGDLASSPEEACVAGVLSDARIPTEGASGTVVHVVHRSDQP